MNPSRQRKSSGSETTFHNDLTDPATIEAGVAAMADDVWDWCEKTGGRGRTVTVKIKWADFQQTTRSSSSRSPVDSRAKLQDVSLCLIRAVLPPAKGIRLVGVTVSNFEAADQSRKCDGQGPSPAPTLFGGMEYR